MATNESVDGKDTIAVQGTATGENSLGVKGTGDATGVLGIGINWHGVTGLSKSTIGGFGVYGRNDAGGTGVVGESSTWMGVYGKTDSTTGGAGVMGEGATGGPGVIGKSQTWHGVYGESASTTGGAGVWGEHKGDASGVVGVSAGGVGVFGQASGPGAAVRGDHATGGDAGFFTGDVRVTGHVFCNGNIMLEGDCQLLGADVAEQFRVEPADGLLVEPGVVMVLAGPDSVRVSDTPYDQRVAGVVSGAGSYRPAIVLDRREDEDRSPLALSGKVWCRVDADAGPIRLGDLLTTSATPGHAMRVADRARGFGAVIGKALGELTHGRGLIPVLVALQ